MPDTGISPSVSKTAAAMPVAPGGIVDRAAWAARIGMDPALAGGPAFSRQYPFVSRLHRIDGRGYHYIDEGEGEPVVMVHGNPTWSLFYRHLVLALKDRHRCLVPDHMGCGFSEKPQDYGYRLERHILNLENWLESVLPPAAEPGGKFILVVHDWGGPIGVGYAVRHPERVRRVVVLNTSAFTAGDMPWRIKLCRLPAVGSVLIRGFNLFAGPAAYMTTLKALTPEVRKYFVMPYNSWTNRVAVDAFVRDIPLESGTPTHALFRRIEDSVASAFAGKPMLVQWGMADWCFTPFFLDLWRKKFPRAEVDEYRAGHYLMEDAGPEITSRIRAFLESEAL